jgi:16S rRNA (uracil1498-N3)-methyltransferase
MRIPRLYLDLPLCESQQLEVPPARAHYLINVLRLQAGRSLFVFNGHGNEFTATLESVSKKSVIISIASLVATKCESPLFTELAIGVSKGDRMDWIVQKATELGVSKISPLTTERSELKLNAERWEKKLNHWREIIISACEQCGRNRLPELVSPLPLVDFLRANSTECKLILSPDDCGFDINKIASPSAVSVLIGPEGGFSTDEVDQAIQARFVSWTLGPRILRTETAPIVALSLLQARFGDL